MKDTSLDNVQFQIDFGPTVQLSDVIDWIRDRYDGIDLADIFDISFTDLADLSNGTEYEYPSED